MILSPVGRSKVSWSHGAITTIPKKPKTTEGSPASSSITGLKTSFIQGLANSEI